MKAGFSLIEIVVAIGLSSIIMMLLYRSFTQTQRIAFALEVTIETQNDELLCADRVYRDVTGMCELENLDEKEGKKIPVADLCVIDHFSTEEEGERVCTFVTTNPLLVYGESKVRMVRVMYTLAKQDERWILTRYESPELGLEQFKKDISDKKIRGYVIMNDISSWSTVCKELDRKNTRERVYDKKNNWSDKKQAEDKRRLLPDYIEITGMIRERKRSREVPFTWVLPVVSTGKLLAKTAAPEPYKQKLAEAQQPLQAKPAESQQKSPIAAAQPLKPSPLVAHSVGVRR